MIRVLKVGGSLLKEPDIVPRLCHWIDTHQPAVDLVVFGGGQIVNAVRDLDEVHHFNPAANHWRCVGLLDATYQIGTEWFAGWRGIDSMSADAFLEIANAKLGDSPRIIRVGGFYHPEQDGGLPENWDTTTDSIAAWLAKRVNADELVLLKSCPVQYDSAGDREVAKSIDDLVKRHVVDPAFTSIGPSLERVIIEQLA